MIIFTLKIRIHIPNFQGKIMESVRVLTESGDQQQQ
jgi:hypothetical protein